MNPIWAKVIVDTVGRTAKKCHVYRDEGATAIESRDRLLVLADREDLALTRQVVESQTPAPPTSLK
ncbi:MAG TPA: hypothetical protein VGL29_05430 [Blastocatellia bacterium]